MIRFMKHYIEDTTTGRKVKVWYNLDGRVDGKSCVTLYAKEYGYELDKIFPGETKNDTDTMTDYFEKSKTVLFVDHPLYKDARKRAESIK